MSVYRDTNADVVFEHPHPGPLTAVVYREGVTLPVYIPASPVTAVGGKFTLALPWQATEFDGTLTIVWTATGFERRQEVSVRTPIVPISRLRTLFQDTNYGDTELGELENDVRLVIEAYTGQKYGHEIGIKYVTGTGEKRMALPERLHKLYTVTGGPITYFSVSADGWYLYTSYKNWLSIKEMPPEEYMPTTTLVGGVIHVPDTYWKQFHRGTTYAVEGEWGYPSVPEDVQEAALLLANDFGSGENLYRDRYLEAIKAGDWNLTFTSGAYQGTGNARADNLLSKYRRQGMVII